MLTHHHRDSRFEENRTTQRILYRKCTEAYMATKLPHIVNSSYQKAGTATTSFHSARRSGLTTLADKEGGVRVLMALARHRAIANTQRSIKVRGSAIRSKVQLA